MDSNAFQLHLATVPLIDDILRDGARRAMAFKLVESAQNHWRKLNGSTLLPAVVAGVIFKDGTKLAA